MAISIVDECVGWQNGVIGDTLASESSIQCTACHSETIGYKTYISLIRLDYFIRERKYLL